MLDDDRPLTVNSIDVNENSPYAVFTVSGAAGQLVQLGLGNTGITSDQDASLNIDTANAGSTALQYFNGTTWVDYTPGVQVPLSGTGTLMVRTRISDDTVYEGAETFTLLATNGGGNIATGVGTIHDDAPAPSTLTTPPAPPTSRPCSTTTAAFRSTTSRSTKTRLTPSSPSQALHCRP